MEQRNLMADLKSHIFLLLESFYQQRHNGSAGLSRESVQLYPNSQADLVLVKVLGEGYSFLP